MSIEKKLLEYRAKQAKQEKIEKIRNKVTNLIKSPFKLFSDSTDGNSSSILPETPLKRRRIDKMKVSDVIKYKKINQEDDISIISSDEGSILSDDESCENCSFSWLKVLFYTIFLTCWSLLYTLFIKWQFGIIYLIISAIFFIYFNTRTAPKKSGEISAYSVFNKDCKSIDGTLKAEQLEREMLFGYL